MGQPTRASGSRPNTSISVDNFDSGRGGIAAVPTGYGGGGAGAGGDKKPPASSLWGTFLGPDNDCAFHLEMGKLTIALPGTDHGLGAERGKMPSGLIQENRDRYTSRRARGQAGWPRRAG